MFEPEKLHFDFRDLLTAPRRALKAKKIWTHLVGLTVGYGAYLILTYMAFGIDGRSFSVTWDHFGLYPVFCLHSSTFSSIGSWVIYAIGLLIWLMITLVAATVVARTTFKELKGEPFYTSRMGLAFTKRHWRTVIFSPLVAVLIILFFMTLALVMALVGKLPFLGEFIFVGLYPLYLLGALFVLYTAVVLGVSILYIPAITAVWEEDAVGTTFQVYTVAWNQSWRMLVYSTLLAALALFSIFAYGWVLTTGYTFINWVFGASWLMGAKLGAILAWAEKITFSGYSSLFCYIPGHVIPLTALAANIDLADISLWQKLIGSVLAVLLLFIYGSGFAFGLSIISVGNTLAFLIYKFRTENEDLLERKDEEDVEEETRQSAVQAESSGDNSETDVDTKQDSGD